MLIQQARNNVVLDKGKMFVIYYEEIESYLKYRIDSGVLDLYCAYVPETSWNKGHGCSLILHALQFAVLNGLRVKPNCKAVIAYIERNPEWKYITVKELNNPIL